VTGAPGKPAPRPTVKAENIEPGQVIKSGGRWYSVISVDGPSGEFAIRLMVASSSGTRHPLAVYRGGDYPVRPPAGAAAPSGPAQQETGFPVIPPGQIEAEAAQDVRRLLKEG
jgi:hypothetical protein